MPGRVIEYEADLLALTQRASSNELAKRFDYRFVGKPCRLRDKQSAIFGRHKAAVADADLTWRRFDFGTRAFRHPLSRNACLKLKMHLVLVEQLDAGVRAKRGYFF